MQRSLLTSFAVLALIIGAAGAAPAAHAQYDSSQNIEAALDQTAATAANSVSDPAAAKARNDYTPDSTDSAYNTVMIKIMTLFSWLVGVAMVTLNYAAYYTVVTMGNYVNNLSAIGVTWSILRDIGNIFLIFGFLAVGITTILNVDWYGGGKKMLPMMFVAAIFLNFSLFITEAVIDTGNLFATQFYTQINDGKLPTAATLADEGISDKIMSQLGLTTIYGQAQNNEKAKEIFKGGNPWIIGFMGIILFIILAFVLFSLAFVLIARFVILIFLIILAPVGFAGLAVPQLASVAKKWWDKLFEQTITAPVLLLMLYIALTIITDERFLTGFGTDQGTDWLGTIRNDIAGFAPVLLSFLVAMGLLLAVVIFAKNLSAFGADKASALAGKLTFGATAWGMRSTVGAGSQRMSQFVRRKFGSTKTGRVFASTLDRGAKANFDIRGATAFGGLKAAGIDAGEAQKGGYRARQEATIKGHEEYIKSVEKAIEDKNVDKVIAAQKKRGAADAASKSAKDEYDAANEAAKSQKAEVARLEKKVAENKKNGVTGFTAYAAIEALTKAKATPEMVSLNKATENLAKATEDLTAAGVAEKKVNDQIANEKKEAKITYAENIQGPFFGNSIPGMVAFGPGGASAAKTMIKEATKKETDAQKALKTLEKVIKDNEAASAPPPAPAGGGVAPAAGGH